MQIPYIYLVVPQCQLTTTYYHFGVSLPLILADLRAFLQ